MTVKRYILKRKLGNLEANSKKEDLATGLETLTKRDLKIIDSSMFPKLVLVESNKTHPEVTSDIELTKNWDVFPEKSYEVPTTKKSIRKNKA
jgi:hypothetical protein